MWSPNHVPYGADQTVYLVVDSLGASGAVCRETEVERTDLEAIVRDLISGRFNDPVRVVAFNTLEHWSNDVSAEVAAEIQARCDINGEPLPEHLKDFAQRHARSSHKLALQLA
jgi:hypothetical protein